MYRGRGPEIPGDGHPLLAALDARGLAVGDIAVVAVSHLHVDHSGGLPLLEDGPPVVDPAARARVRAHAEAAVDAAYVPERLRRPAIAWRELDGDGVDRARDRRAVTPGHTPGHMSYRVRGRRTGRRGCSRWTRSICRRASTRTRRSAGRPSRTTCRCAARRTTGSCALAAEEGATLVRGPLPGHVAAGGTAVRRALSRATAPGVLSVEHAARALRALDLLGGRVGVRRRGLHPLVPARVAGHGPEDVSSSSSDMATA